MIRKLLSRLTVASLLVLLAHNPAWAIDYRDDANCIFATLMNQDDEGSGSLQDESGENNHWPSSSWPDYTATGKYDGGYTLDDSQRWNNQDALGTNAKQSMVIWVYPTAYEGTATLCGIYGVTGWSSGSFYFRIRTSVSELQFGVNGNDPEGQTIAWGNETNEWFHLGVTYDSVAKETIIYKAGVGDDTALTTAVSLDTENMMIGSSYDTNRYFTGTKDEPGIFDDILTSTEMNNIMDNGLSGDQAVAAADIALFFGANI